MKAISDFRVPDTEGAYPLFMTKPFSAMWVSLRTRGARSRLACGSKSSACRLRERVPTCNLQWSYCSGAYPRNWSIRAYGCCSRVIWVSGWCDLGTVPRSPKTHNKKRAYFAKCHCIHMVLGQECPSGVKTEASSFSVVPGSSMGRAAVRSNAAAWSAGNRICSEEQEARYPKYLISLCRCVCSIVLGLDSRALWRHGSLLLSLGVVAGRGGDGGSGGGGRGRSAAARRAQGCGARPGGSRR